MLVYLIRHTRPDVPDGMCYGQSDVPLACSFDSETDQVRYKLRELPVPDVVFSSPLSRCKRLADSVAQGEVKTDDRLREMSFGDWELRLWDDLDRSELDDWASNFVERPPPRGESLGELYARVSHWLDQLLRLSHETVAVVTHAGVIRCCYVYASGAALSTMFDFSVDYGEVLRMEIFTADEHTPIVRL